MKQDRRNFALSLQCLATDYIMDKPIAHFILTKMLWALWLIVTLPIWLPVVWLAESIEARGQQNILAWAIRLALLFLLIGLYWLSKKMSYHMTIEGLTFIKGVRAGFQDARLHLTFLPLVGHWFIERPDEREDDDSVA